MLFNNLAIAWENNTIVTYRDTNGGGTSPTPTIGRDEAPVYQVVEKWKRGPKGHAQYAEILGVTLRAPL